MYSYDGWDVLNFGAEEVENPRSTMSFAILVGMSCVTTIYATINLSYFVVLDVAAVKSSPAVAMARRCFWDKNEWLFLRRILRGTHWDSSNT